MRRNNQMPRSYGLTMNSLKHIIQRCHQRHEKPLRQRKTVVTPALYKGLPYHFTVHCAWKYPVRLYELEHADISFMPIGRAPEHDHGPRSFGGERFLKRQSTADWEAALWHKSWGIQVYTGTPSERDEAQWHDIDFTYDAICTAPDAVLACIESLINAVANPLLTMTKSGGLRFSCRVLNYLHPNTREAKQYIYKDASISENLYHRDVYLEILGEAGYSRWDARYEILLGNLSNPPIIAKEVLFAFIDALRDTLHQPAAPSEQKLEPTQVASVVPVSLGSHNLNLARQAFLKRGFSYVRRENRIHHWALPDSGETTTHILLWEDEDGLWVRASTPDTGLPMETTLITDIWDDTGILPPIPATGLPVTDKVLAVREGKLSPLAIKRPSPVLRKQENKNTVYRTLEENAVQMQRVFNRDARILGLIAEIGAGKSYATESYVLNGGAIRLNQSHTTTEEAERRFQKRNAPSVARWKNRLYLWKQVKDIPAEVRMANPFQHGNICEDAERCDALEKKGGNPNESICPQCPVYTECQQRGYLSQPITLQRAKAQIFNPARLFLDPRHSRRTEEIFELTDDTERLCIIDEVTAQQLFVKCAISRNTLEEWRVNWRESSLGNFASALLHALETKGALDENAVRRIRTVRQVFERQEEKLVQQMCQINISGKVEKRGMFDNETGKELARFTIEFGGDVSAYIPLDTDAADRLRAKGLPVFDCDCSELNKDVKIPMSVTQAIALGILDTSTVKSIRTFPTAYSDPNWTFWHQLKRFFAHYTRDADAPMLWTGKHLQFSVPSVLHPRVKRFLFMSSTISERDLHRVFPDEKIKVAHIKPTAWVAGNQIFQLRTGIYPRQEILNYDTDWDILGMSKTGQRFFLGIQAEIERDPNVKHAIITSAPILQHLQNIVAKKNVLFATGFKKIKALDISFETVDVIWIVGVPYWLPGLIWRRAQILFGNDEKPLCYEGDIEYCDYKDERVQSIHERQTTHLYTEIIGRMGLSHLPNKKVVLLTGIPLPDITDRPETLLFDWEDFEVAGGLDKLPDVIAERQRFERERDNLTSESERENVEQVLGISKSQANRVLMKLRGGKIQRIPFHDQIRALLEGGEKTTTELTTAIEGHPGAVKNELKRLVDNGVIVKVRRGMYALPKA